VEVLGEDRAKTLMAYLPTFDPSYVADRLTRIETDIAVVKSDLSTLRSDFKALRSDFGALQSNFTALSGQVSTRLDRMTLTILAGFVVTIASVVATNLA
jgi:hypothetical protein